MKILAPFLFFFVLIEKAQGLPTLFGVSGEARLERGMDQNTDFQGYYNVFGSVGLGETYFLGFEYFRGPTENTGPTGLSYSRVRSGLMGTGMMVTQYTFLNFAYPYLDAGIGFARESVTTSLLGSSSSDTSRNYLVGFGGVGIRFAAVRTVFLAFEGRLIFGENQDPQPTVAPLLRVGLSF